VAPGLALREFCGAQANDEGAQPLDGTGGLLQAFLGEVQLAAIGYRGQEKPQRRGFDAGGEQFAQGQKIADLDLDIFSESMSRCSA
jgi:hypothetical protein